MIFIIFIRISGIPHFHDSQMNCYNCYDFHDSPMGFYDFYDFQNYLMDFYVFVIDFRYYRMDF